MVASENGKDNNEEQKPDPTPEERLEEIKKEEKEDASAYYAQGKEPEEDLSKEYEKPLPEIDKRQEDINLFKAVAFLGFGLAALAIVFILFFIRDLDSRMVHMGSAVSQVDSTVNEMGGKVSDMDSAVNSLEASIAPLRQEMDDKINAVSANVDGVKAKVGQYERSMAIMELKRALVTVQDLSMGDSSEVKAKSNSIADAIQALLSDFGVAGQSPAGTIEVMEATSQPDEPDLDEPVSEEPAAEEPVADEAPAESPEEEPAAPADDEAAEGDDAEDGDDEDSDDEDDSDL